MGPLSGGDRWTRRARRLAAWMRPVYERTGMCVRRPAAAEHEHAGQDARSAPIRGGLLFGYFLLATQEKVTRAQRENVLSSRSDDALAERQPLIYSNKARCNSFAAGSQQRSWSAAPATANNLDCTTLHPGYVPAFLAVLWLALLRAGARRFTHGAPERR